MTIEEGDLFTQDATWSLAHCVSTDFVMGAGIATVFKTKYGRVGDLLAQKVGIGEVATLLDKHATPPPPLLGKHPPIFYLVTKEKYWHKPTLKAMEQSLTALAKACVKHNVDHLASLDKLNWSSVEKLIKQIVLPVTNVHILLRENTKNTY